MGVAGRLCNHGKRLLGAGGLDLQRFGEEEFFFVFRVRRKFGIHFAQQGKEGPVTFACVRRGNETAGYVSEFRKQRVEIPVLGFHLSDRISDASAVERGFSVRFRKFFEFEHQGEKHGFFFCQMTAHRGNEFADDQGRPYEFRMGIAMDVRDLFRERRHDPQILFQGCVEIFENVTDAFGEDHGRNGLDNARVRRLRTPADFHGRQEGNGK